jgi:formylglycine-generating enzyme required for sulfatase activity/energy-coupling factor transporter ATP-binding protein EcfA2
VTLTDTFVPLRLSDTLRNETRFMPGSSYNNQRNDGIRSPEEVLRIAFKKKYRKLLVVGEPGSGKTTLLYYYALLCLDTKPLERRGFRVPKLLFYLPLRELTKTGEKFALLPANLWAFSERHSHAIGEDVFFDWLHSTTTLVLLDGLDEISDIAERIKVCGWIDNAVISFPKAYFIVTSRPSGYRKVDKIKLEPKPVRVDIMDFTSDQQKIFLHRWFEAAFLESEAPFADQTAEWQKSQKEKAETKAKTIIAFLRAEENKSLQSLAGIPLLLQMMAMLWKNRDYLPPSRVELYGKALIYILDDRERQIGNIPLLSAEQALDVLRPVSLWMQEELKMDEVGKEAMQKQMQVELIKLPDPPKSAIFCNNLVNRAGLLVEYGEKEYLFRHKSFREYMAATQLLKNIEHLQVDSLDKTMNGASEYLGELAAHFGEAWWKEPICFFAAKANAVTFNAFLEQLFDSPVSLDFLQGQQDLLERVMQEGPKAEFGVLHSKLLDPATTANRQRYLLKCLQISRHQASGDVVRQFIEQNLAQDDDIRRRAADFTVTGVIDRQGAPYVLIEGGSFVYSVKKKQQTVPNLHVARYTVTNQLYRRFIAYLDGNEAHFATILPLERYKEHLSTMAQGVGGFRRYLKGRDNLATLFRSRFDDDRKVNGDEQPVVGVSWYAARAYCLWLSLLESNGGNAGLYRLPTEVEWEYAAGGKTGRTYPWGKEEPSSTRANYGKNEGVTTPVGRYPEGVTPEGLYDMAGNVWEWMENSYGFGLLPMIVSVILTILVSLADKRLYGFYAVRALREAYYNSNADALRCSSRYYAYPRIDGSYVGFRVIRSSHSSLPENLIL